MSKIKIMSNPYKKEISYYSWSNFLNDWRQITRETNPNSSLLGADMTASFFPFVANKIVDVIIAEYIDETENVEIVFSGTGDEFKDLQEICLGDNYIGRVSLTMDEVYLENARDILPDITDIFDSIKPLVDISFNNNTDKIESELKRFLEASADKIPICVLGNYSSGKSTFINALIGNEILPCGDEPVTAKIYMIEKSLYPDRASVEFLYKNQKIKIRLDDKSYKYVVGNVDDELENKLKDVIEEVNEKTISHMINCIIELLNSWGKDDDIISDLIKISIPFGEGILSQSNSEFVIFDTPGSNSASNDRHLKVLKRAMEGFSNGLPVYISEYDALDSTDNEKLYQVIKSMKELDDRFTMIIVNKSDVARLPKGNLSLEDEEKILNLAIPRNLYRDGIFFVSSIMGLGAKTKGEFIDEHLAEIFEDQKNKYLDANSRFYKKLYRYDILPKQIKNRVVTKSEENENIIYANSGLLAIENEIQTFANRYSSYNKCQQSHLFLSKVIQITSREIEDTKTDRENFKQRISDRLDRDKKDLMSGIETRGQQLEHIYCEEYTGLVEGMGDNLQFTYTLQDIQKNEAELICNQENEHKMTELKNDAEGSRKALYAHFRTNVANIVKKPSIEAFKDTGSEWKKDQKQLTDMNEAIDAAQKDSYIQASDELIEATILDFTKRLTSAKDEIEDKSEKYWIEKITNIKDELANIVTESTALSEERKAELTSIIFDYQDIVYDKSVDEIFVKESFEKGLRFGKRIIVKNERLNLEKIMKKYNTEYASSLTELCERILENYKQCVERWREKLINLILNNIVEVNPTLHDQASVITETLAKIKELENRQLQLTHYTEDIREMMNWKAE